MRWVSTVSRLPDLARAVDEASRALRAGLGDDEPDLLVAFVSQQHQPCYGDVPALIRRQFDGGTLVGCSAGGVIGGGREVEGEAGFSLTLRRRKSG